MCVCVCVCKRLGGLLVRECVWLIGSYQSTGQSLVIAVLENLMGLWK